MPKYKVTDAYDIMLSDSHKSEYLPYVWAADSESDADILSKLRQVGVLKDTPEDNACWLARNKRNKRISVIGPCGPVDEARGEIVWFQLDVV